eukprot:g8707.t1
MAGINWPGLLAWSTKYHDGTAPSQFKQMTEEDRKFLEKAMEEAFGQIEDPHERDPNKVMTEARDQLVSEARSEESITTALEVIDRCCDDPDCARNAEKLDVLQPLLDLLPAYPGSVRLRTGTRRRNAARSSEAVYGDRPGEPRVAGHSREEHPVAAGESGRILSPYAGRKRQLAARGEPSPSVASFASALAKLFGHLEDAGIQQFLDHLGPMSKAKCLSPLFCKETLASCALQLASSFKAECPAELQAAVKRRMEELLRSKDPEGEPELALLKESLGNGSQSTISCEPCAAGTWSPWRGTPDFSSCEPCPEGRVCPVGTGNVSQGTICPEGHICGEGTTPEEQTAIRCYDGFFCRSSTTSGAHESRESEEPLRLIWPTGRIPWKRSFPPWTPTTMARFNMQSLCTG